MRACPTHTCRSACVSVVELTARRTAATCTLQRYMAPATRCPTRPPSASARDYRRRRRPLPRAGALTARATRTAAAIAARPREVELGGGE